MSKEEENISQARKWLKKVAQDNIETFFELINEIADDHEKFLPFLFDKGKPKTEEQKKSEEKWIDEQKQIKEYHNKFQGEILAFTRREGELILVAHALLEKKLFKNISTAVKNDKFNRKTEFLFFN